MTISLDNLRAHAAVTAPNGAINADTIFHFTQRDNRVDAHYAGGPVESGHLVGATDGRTLTFTYCQRHTDGSLHHGASTCELRLHHDGRREIAERFQWDHGAGENIIRELAVPRDASTP